jgi:hypothetical protein
LLGNGLTIKGGLIRMDSFKERHFGIHEGRTVPLESPLIEGPELNQPKRSSGNKKYVVYVKDPKTDKIKKIQFGNEKGVEGLDVKINDKDAAKSFAARHQCDLKTDKLSPGYWACRLPKYAKQLGLKGGGDYFW